MPELQNLKKKLRSIRSTQKLTKAMKTVSTVKFSKLNGIYGQHIQYNRQCRDMASAYGSEFSAVYPVKDENAPSLLVVFTSNKGLCGSFNSEIVSFALNEKEKRENCLILSVGKKGSSYLKAKGAEIFEEYLLSDVPSYEESSALFEKIEKWRSEGTVSEVYAVYPEYRNIMKQTPEIVQLLSSDGEGNEESIVFVPDRKTVIENAAKTVYHDIFYEIVLESALGAQAATLTTMRAAYDTATEYCAELEGQINRLRQSAVTSDVIETSAEVSE